jgi:hypothetical protein
MVSQTFTERGEEMVPGIQQSLERRKNTSGKNKTQNPNPGLSGESRVSNQLDYNGFLSMIPFIRIKSNIMIWTWGTAEHVYVPCS